MRYERKNYPGTVKDFKDLLKTRTRTRVLRFLKPLSSNGFEGVLVSDITS